MKIRIDPDGTVVMLYTEAIDLGKIGKVISIRRASHVEPTAKMQWISDMSPSSGGILGPFATRSAALDDERKWLEERL